MMKWIIISALLILSTYNAYNQSIKILGDIDTSRVYKVVTFENNVFIGKILAIDSIAINMSTKIIQSIVIPINGIQSLSEVETGYRDKWFPNPNATRYLLGPSAFPEGKGHGYFQNTMVFVNSLNIGVTNKLSLGAGLNVLPVIALFIFNEPQPLFFITSRYNWNVSQQWNLAAGGAYVRMSNFNDNSLLKHVGMVYGLGTYGTRDHNVTIGVYQVLHSKDSPKIPLISLSGTVRVFSIIGAVSENWFIAEAENYISLNSIGMRIFSKSLTLDISMLGRKDNNKKAYDVSPYLDLSVSF